MNKILVVLLCIAIFLFGYIFGINVTCTRQNPEIVFPATIDIDFCDNLPDGKIYFGEQWNGNDICRYDRYKK